jgi:hypothetical protein
MWGDKIMQETEIKNLIKAWHARSKRERDKISKFVFLWFCFNAWLAYRSGENKDREMVNSLKRRGGKVSDLVSRYDEALGSSWFEGKIEELKRLSPIQDPRGRGAPVNINDVCNFGQICEAIYRIRCNLFHGGKTPTSNRDVKLVTVAGEILEKWVGNLVGSW